MNAELHEQKFVHLRTLIFLLAAHWRPWITNKPEACSVCSQRLHRLTHNALLVIKSLRS